MLFCSFFDNSTWPIKSTDIIFPKSSGVLGLLFLVDNSFTAHEDKFQVKKQNSVSRRFLQLMAMTCSLPNRRDIQIKDDNSMTLKVGYQQSVLVNVALDIATHKTTTPRCKQFRALEVPKFLNFIL